MLLNAPFFDWMILRLYHKKHHIFGIFEPWTSDRLRPSNLAVWRVALNWSPVNYFPRMAIIHSLCRIELARVSADVPVAGQVKNCARTSLCGSFQAEGPMLKTTSQLEMLESFEGRLLFPRPVCPGKDGRSLPLWWVCHGEKKIVEQGIP